MPRDLNGTAPPRPGEELDAERLAAYLHMPVLGIEQFPAGHSNLTYLVKTPGAEWVLRRPPFGSRVKSAHDMGREFRVLDPLHRVYAPAPKPLVFCEDESVLGAPFYLMERRIGFVLRKDLTPPYLGNRENCRILSDSVVGGLADLHLLELQRAGLAGLGKPQGYVTRQIEGWTRRWEGSKTQYIHEMEYVAKFLWDQRPTEVGASLIHNDYKLDNLILDSELPGRIVAVLDWEMATVGDPLMDLGSALAYWVEPNDPDELQMAGFSPTQHPGFYSREEFIANYAKRTARRIDRPEYYYAYGLFKLAVILQQIYVRWVEGLTKDERFARLHTSVGALARQAYRTIL
ncbi:MAG: phosphotransferase family protein [Bryobacterales bacterium]|nr:phosphotransferase family protein [Bryobacterales bacterium]